ncbi:uncharacterized protein LOC123508376 [Portunus trituberculatus]|uniref:uncharacterized protein LOC123508376 n=1 Tax=Portunus trituberculatus TaxID=210409 RepID=UPI001E1D03F6|nr:uncharacterized protein LOC123508376 [Portunus trituberculatus]
MEGRQWWWRWSLFSRLLLFIFLLLPLEASLTSSDETEVVVMYEGCGDAAHTGMMLASPTTHLLRLPCRAASVSSLSTTASVSSHSFPVVVIASCSVINTVISSLATNATVETGPIFPVPSTSLLACPMETQTEIAAATPALHPVERVLNALLSWMTYHSWNTLTVLHDRFIDHVTFTFFMKRLLAEGARLGARLSFREMSSDATNETVAEVVATVVDAWRNNGANHVTVIASEETIVHLLHVIPGFEVEDGESDCDWLIFTSMKANVPREYKPTNGHNVFFADTPVHMTLEERSRAAVKMARDFVDTCHAPQAPDVTVYVRRPDYEAELVPKVTLGRPRPRLVPAFTWTPPPAHPSWAYGRIQQLSSYEQYLLYGAHLTVATVEGSPFIEPLGQPNLNATDSVHQERPDHLPPHINCSQPRNFSGFLVDMLKVISKEMNFTFDLYEVCDKAYGRVEDGRWTGVVGEVVRGHAHIGLANLGANYGRSHAIAFPRISTSYGGAGIIVRRPESTAKDRLTVYMLPFSSGVWAFLLVSIPIASLAMYLATIPRRRLNRRLLRLLSAWRGYGSVRKPSPVPSSPVKIFVTSASENATRTRLWDVDVSWSALVLREKGEEKSEAKEEEEEDVPCSFLDGLWFASTVLMQQGQEVVPNSGVARAVFGVVWVSSVILYAAYTSNLVSHFTVTRLSLPVNNLEELVNSDYKFGTRPGSVYIDNFKASDTGVYQAASHKLQSFGTSVLMPTYEDAIRRTLQGSYAFIGDSVVLDYYQRKDCDLVLLKQRLFPTMSSIALPHGSPLLPAFNYYLSLMSESGILEKLRQKWWSAQPCPSAATLTAYHSISMMEVFSALVVMGAGLAVALMVCCLECARPPRP